MSTPGCVYLIHLDKPLGEPDQHRDQHGRGPRVKEYQAHAQHYIGYTKDLAARVEEHRSGQGAALLRAANSRGIRWSVARTWKGTRALERELKNQKNAPRFCPICNPCGWRRSGLSAQPDYKDHANEDRTKNTRSKRDPDPG